MIFSYLNFGRLIIYFLSINFLVIGNAFGQDTIVHRFVVQHSSTLNINGTSNVKDFQCKTSSCNSSDTLELVRTSEKAEPVFIKNLVSINASEFDCGMSMMTNGFLEDIKAKEYPQIKINFLSFQRLPKYEQGIEKINCHMMISLAGTSKTFNIKCILETDKSGFVHLKGEKFFKFSDFNLKPRKPMLGLVKINESLQVIFDLVLKVLK